MKKKIAIIGAGVAGLTLANLIKRYTEHEFMVYEREESLSLEEGYGIQLATNSVKILNQISFNEINNDKIFHPKTIDFYNIQNEKICDLNLSKFNSTEAKYTTLQRSTLIEFLKEDIYTQHLKFGKNYIIPKPHDSRLSDQVTKAVAEAAINSNVSKTI